MINYKKILIGLKISLVSLVFLTLPAQAFAATLGFSPATGTFNQGCNFSLHIELDTGGAQTDGTDAVISFDPTRFTATSIVSGTIYPEYPGNSIDNQTGKINVSGIASPDVAFSSKGTLATLNFTVPKTAPTGAAPAVSFQFDPNFKAKTTDSNVIERGTIIDLLSSVTNGSYTIGNGACSAQTPTSGGGTTTGTTTTPQTSLTTGQGATGTTPAAQLKELSPGGTTPGLEGPTLVLTVAGVSFVLLGILGLALF